MKEKIYTIIINDALNKNSECPLCLIKNTFVEQSLDFYLGDAMMEPKIRIETNKKGFCSQHIGALLERRAVLPFALMMQTRLETLIGEFSDCRPGKRSKAFKHEQTCAVCDRVDGQMRRVVNNFKFLLESDRDFLERFKNSNGLCLSHYADLSDIKNKALLAEVFDVTLQNLRRAESDVSAFCRSFDYRNSAETANPAAPKIAAEKQL